MFTSLRFDALLQVVTAALLIDLTVHQPLLLHYLICMSLLQTSNSISKFMILSKEGCSVYLVQGLHILSLRLKLQKRKPKA